MYARRKPLISPKKLSTESGRSAASRHRRSSKQTRHAGTNLSLCHARANLHRLLVCHPCDLPASTPSGRCISPPSQECPLTRRPRRSCKQSAPSGPPLRFLASGTMSGGSRFGGNCGHWAGAPNSWRLRPGESEVPRPAHQLQLQGRP